MLRASLLLLAVALGSACAPATELCTEWPRRIEPDMQMSEAEFSDQAAASARQLLDRTASGEIGADDWTLRANAEKVIEGNALLRAARGKPAESPEVKTFCQFLVTKGFTYD